MVCPMCITAAIVANAPGLAAAAGGFVAAKAAMSQRERRPASPGLLERRPLAADKPVARAVPIERRNLAMPSISSFEEDW